MVRDLDSIFNPQMNGDIHQRCSFLNRVVALYPFKLDFDVLAGPLCEHIEGLLVPVPFNE